MDEMTDYEINRRFAEIAGVRVRSTMGSPDGTRLPSVIVWKPEKTEAREGYTPWSPLTDWGQLGPLVERYVYRIERGYPGENSCYAAAVSFPEPGEWVMARGPDCADLKRAIALAIIAAHEE